jgi:hypothetical protein
MISESNEQTTPSPGNDEPTQPVIGHSLEAADRTFSRHLLDIDAEWNALASALRAHNLDEIKTIAPVVLASWLAAQTAAKVLETRMINLGTRVQRAKSALRHHGRALADLFRRAVVQTEGTELHELLLRLSSELTHPEGVSSSRHDATPRIGGGLPQDDVGTSAR